jgi:Integrase/Phage integrase, N-terminal
MKHLLLKELMQLCERNKDGSFSTQAARRDILGQVGRHLLVAGFRNLGADGLKPKHVTSLLAAWKTDGLSVATVKNRMAHLRWWAEKVGKQNVIPRTNDELELGRRKFVTNVSKARTLPDAVLDCIKNERLKISLELQKAFGLRREESLKFQPVFALGGVEVSDAKRIQLAATWCKGGRAREVPVKNEYQRDLIARALAVAGNGSLIPPEKNYVQWLSNYEQTTRRAGLSKMHGLRHNYAQNLYKELTGWDCPAVGGFNARSLTLYQKRIDLAARLQVSRELGHNREAITSIYLGR